MERKRNLKQPGGTSEREVPSRPENFGKIWEIFQDFTESLQDHLVVCHLVLFDLPETLRKVVKSELRFFLA